MAKANMDIGKAMALVQKAQAKGIEDALEYLLQKANETIPFEQGDLARSGSVDVDGQATVVRGAVSYDAVYAARQHEETDWRHSAGRRAKWLEMAMKEQAFILPKIVAARIKAVLK